MMMGEDNLRRITLYNEVAKRLMETEIVQENVAEFSQWTEAKSRNI